MILRGFLPIVFGSIGLFGLCARAEDAPKPPPAADARRPQGASPMERFERMQKAVMDLATDDQKAKLEPLFKKAQDQVKDVQAAIEKLDAQRREQFPKAHAGTPWSFARRCWGNPHRRAEGQASRNRPRP